MINLFDIHYNKENEITEIILENETVRIEKITSCGQKSPDGFYYDQNGDEWVSILEGRGTIEYDDGYKVSLEKGDNILIPAHKKHRVSFTSQDPPCVWLCVFYKKADV